MSQPLTVYEFGRELLKADDLDPVYTVLWEAQLPGSLLRRWLLSYWCFYHVGTASWCVEDYKRGDYWTRMEKAAGSKEWPRSSERRHFRGNAALKSVAYLKERGVACLFHAWDRAKEEGATLVVDTVTRNVKEWYGFGDWIAFKVADMLERLGQLKVHFTLEAAMYDSPTKGAKALWDLEGQPKAGFGDAVGGWAVERILKEMKGAMAPPRFERPIGVQECETILCKWKSYLGGHYHIGEDVEAIHKGLTRFQECQVSQHLLSAGGKAGLW